MPAPDFSSSSLLKDLDWICLAHSCSFGDPSYFNGILHNPAAVRKPYTPATNSGFVSEIHNLSVLFHLD